MRCILLQPAGNMKQEPNLDELGDSLATLYRSCLLLLHVFVRSMYLLTVK